MSIGTVRGCYRVAMMAAARTRMVLAISAVLTTLMLGCEPGGGAPIIRNDLPYAIVVINHRGEQPSVYSLARILHPRETVTPTWIYADSSEGYFRVRAFHAGALADQAGRDIPDLSIVQQLEEVFCRRVSIDSLKAKQYP